MLERALSDQIVGFYVPATDELVVRSSGSKKRLRPLDEITLAHELEHALADQRLGFPARQATRATSDRALAAQAVIEGDATLTMLHYLTKLMAPGEQIEALSDPTLSGAASEAAAKLPHYVRRALEFPYTSGLEFICGLYQRGGWRAVNRAYRSPPVDAAQVLFPQRYHRRDEGIAPPELGGLPRDWRRRFRQPLSAADLLWLFEAPGGDASAAMDDPRAAAAGWGGGTVELWTRGPASAVGVSLVQRRGRRDLCGAIEQWYSRAFPGRDLPVEAGEVLATRAPDQAAVLRCRERHVLLAIAPSVTLARTLLR